MTGGDSRKKRRVTQKDVAELAGVSTGVVSYVLNDGPRSVSPETRQRVLDAIEQLGYRPNRHAQNLMRDNWDTDIASRQVGIVAGGDITMLTRPYYAAILSGIYAEAQRHGLRVRFIQFCDALKEDPILFNELVHPEEVSGLILIATYMAKGDDRRIQVLERAVERIENAVCLERGWQDVPSVTYDLIGAARTAVEHLVKLGHRRIGYVGDYDDRAEGYRQVLLENGLGFDESLMCLGRGNLPEAGRQGTFELFGLSEPPTAIFAVSDEVGIGVLRGAYETGRSVPTDLAVVSIDDIELAAFQRPALTTVRVPQIRLGAYAVRMLTERISRSGDPPISIVLPTELIVRESCGASKR